MKPSNPLEHLVVWYAKQPKVVKGQIAAFTLILHPECKTKFPENDAFLDVEPIFEKWLNEKISSPYQVIGKILNVRGAMEFLLLRQFGTEIEWERKKDNHERMLAEAESRGDKAMMDIFQRSLDQFPEREREWREASSSWKALANSAISFEVMEAWLEEIERDLLK